MEEASRLSTLLDAFGEEEADRFPDETGSAATSAFLRLARRFAAGVVEEDELLLGIEELVPTLREAYQTHLDLWPMLDLSEAQKAQAHQASAHFQAFGLAVTQMVDAFLGADPALVEAAVEASKPHVEVLEAWGRELAILERAEIDPICRSCGYRNGSTASACAFCGEALPGPSEAYEADRDFVWLPGRLAELVEWTDEVVQDTADLEEWQDELEELRVGLADTREAIRQVLALETEGRGFLHPCQELAQALERAEEGLALMAGYGESGDSDQLDEGWFLVVAQIPALRARGRELVDSLQRAWARYSRLQ